MQLCEKYAAKSGTLPPPHTIEPKFLRSDYIPSESERIQLRSVLEMVEPEIECYEEDIAILRKTPDRLETRKRALKLTASQCQAALSVQRRMPSEVWGMIFSTLCLSLHKYSFNIVDVEPLLQLPAFLISQVCSRWRNIVWELPAVWSSINADLVDCDSSRNFDSPLNVYLSNSKGYPLTLRIAFPEPQGLPPCGFNIWTMLSRYMGKCRELTLALECDLPPISDLTFPNLEVFAEEMIIDNTTWHWFWKAIHDAPKLVRFSTTYLRDSSVLFSQLTMLEIESLTLTEEVEDLLNILPRCRCLITLKVRVENDGNGSSAVARNVMLPSLCRLSINEVEDEDNWLSTILQSLDAPSLEFCDISCTKLPVPSSLLAMTRRSSASLKQMALSIPDRSPFDDTDISSSNSILFEILQTASELTHFELKCWHGSYNFNCSESRLCDDMVSTLLLELKNNPRNFLPKLHLLSIELHGFTLDMQLMERILEVVLARQTTPSSLKVFCLRRSFCVWNERENYRMEPEMVERVDSLAKNGVQVVVGP